MRKRRRSEVLYGSESVGHLTLLIDGLIDIKTYLVHCVVQFVIVDSIVLLLRHDSSEASQAKLTMLLTEEIAAAAAAAAADYSILIHQVLFGRGRKFYLSCGSVATVYQFTVQFTVHSSLLPVISQQQQQQQQQAVSHEKCVACCVTSQATAFASVADIGARGTVPDRCAGEAAGAGERRR